MGIFAVEAEENYFGNDDVGITQTGLDAHQVHLELQYLTYSPRWNYIFPFTSAFFYSSVS